MNASIPNKGKVNAFVKPIIPLELPAAKTGKDEVKSIGNQCHNTPGDNTTGKYTIKITMYDSCDPEYYLLQGHAKAEFDRQTTLTGAQNVATSNQLWP